MPRLWGCSPVLSWKLKPCLLSRGLAGRNAVPQGPGTGDLACLLVSVCPGLPDAVYKVRVSVVACGSCVPGREL